MIVRVNGAGQSSSFSRRHRPRRGVCHLHAIVLPKATPERCRRAAARSGPPVIAIVETAQGVRLAYEIGVAPAGRGARCSVRSTSAPSSASSRGPTGSSCSIVALEARARLRPRPDQARPSTSSIVDVARRRGRSRRSARLARSLGFRGKACIHPCAGRRSSTRLRAERGRARAGRAKVLERLRRRRGAEGAARCALDGAMIDLPVVERARRLLADDRKEVARWRLNRRRARRSGAAVLRGLRRRRRVPQPARPHDHRDRQHLVHVPDAEHEPDPLQRRSSRSARVRASRSSTAPSRSRWSRA